MLLYLAGGHFVAVLVEGEGLVNHAATPVHHVKVGLQFRAAGAAMTGGVTIEEDGLFPDWLGFGRDSLDKHLLSDGIEIIDHHTFEHGVALHLRADLQTESCGNDGVADGLLPCGQAVLDGPCSFLGF